MSSSAVDTPRANHVAITEDELIVGLVDGRTITVPLAWFPALLHASPEQRNAFRLIGDGEYINWPELDEDLSVAGLLRGPGRHAGIKRNGNPSH
ncbi:MAG TPA: DUF2442 domain-containing protein [Thermoanaerobaculia bacterium]|nr:DUF2442 domain-containing protein [Thermoanaerobaculia bacterium]